MNGTFGIGKKYKGIVLHYNSFQSWLIQMHLINFLHKFSSVFKFENSIIVLATSYTKKHENIDTNVLPT